MDSSSESASQRKEIKAFLFIIIFFFPIATTIFVGGYGFIVWMLQILFGPPGHG